MARKKYYLPTEDAKLVAWLQNLSSKIGGYAAKYNLTPAEVQFVQEAAAYFIFWFNALSQLKASVQKVTGFKKEIAHGVPAGGSPSVTPTDILFGVAPTAVPPGILKVIRSIAARIKKHQAYTTTDGEDLRIEGDEQTDDLNTLKPVFKIVMQSGFPNLVWTKGISQGVKIKVARFSGQVPVPPPTDPTDVAFKFLAIDTQPDYLDTTPLPPFGQSVVCAYAMIYMIGDEEVGEWSDIVTVTVSGTP